jgi:hypothetical protein
MMIEIPKEWLIVDYWDSHKKLLSERDEARTLCRKYYAELQKMTEERDALQEQVDKLANYIMAYIPGEPSQSEGAIDCAIRLLSTRETKNWFPLYKDVESERDALQKRLDMAVEGLNRISSFDCGFIVNNIITNLLAQIRGDE